MEGMGGKSKTGCEAITLGIYGIESSIAGVDGTMGNGGDAIFAGEVGNGGNHNNGFGNVGSEGNIGFGRFETLGVAGHGEGVSVR
ncbi:hypothetical protein QJS10_CPA06g02134 [Acorus calamus]|uniref:Uncharacterized protein n=1 Tax=Acorus calamus TaxID=4465 RepID=A0AAV9ES66_ACOCL|nr:hypothetical protein QJS10_CPA06g02134 [Acorus calamus]